MTSTATSSLPGTVALMPEGVEVELVRRGLDPALGSRIISVDLSQAGRLLRHHVPGATLGHLNPNTLLPGAVVRSSSRQGKHLLFTLTRPAGPSPLFLGIHLGMSGVLTLSDPSIPPLSWTRARLLLAPPDGAPLVELRFRDPRAFGYFALSDDLEVGPWTGAGLDILTSPPAALSAVYHSRLAASSRPLKDVLLDQRIVSGIGNIYADEALYAARLHPLTPARALSAGDWSRLVRATRRVMFSALRRGGSTLSDGTWYRPDGSEGDAVSTHKVYGRAGRRCPRCRASLERVVLSGRSTHFCPTCQPAP